MLPLAMTPDRLLRFLVVEDNDDHARLIELAFEREGLNDRVDRVRSGLDAITYLRREGRYTDRPMPDLVLLDLKLAGGMDGHEVLEIIRSDERLATIPVIVLSTSDMESDRDKAYRRGANSYLAKPLDYEELIDLVRMLNRYWLNLNLPPSRAVANN